MKSKKTKTGTKEQADAVTEAQLQAMFGETIKSISELLEKKRQKKKKQHKSSK